METEPIFIFSFVTAVLAIALFNMGRIEKLEKKIKELEKQE